VDELLKMSTKELSRLEVMHRLAEGRMSQREAGSVLGVSVRQVKRVLRAYRREGAQGLVSKRRGRASNNRLAQETKQKALELLKSKYSGFRPTLAHEKLAEVEGLRLSAESVRQLMIVEGLWKAKKARKLAVHQMRERRACFGELVQIDGSAHDWFEGRAPGCTLLAFIDDASGRLGQLLFVESESFFSYCRAAEGYFIRHGKPGAFYSDKHGNQPASGKTDALTQFGRAMQELEVQIICANTPQAEGRVERVIQTLQDRLRKELRLRDISSWDAGNAYLPEFIDDFNRRFAVQPRSSHDAHRPLTLQDNKVVYQIQTQRPSYALRQATLTVCLDAQGNISLLYKGKPLEYTIFHQQAKQAEVVPSKHLDLALINQSKAHKPLPNHPWRKGLALTPAK
jgi:transposase